MVGREHRGMAMVALLTPRKAHTHTHTPAILLDVAFVPGLLSLAAILPRLYTLAI